MSPTAPALTVRGARRTCHRQNRTARLHRTRPETAVRRTVVQVERVGLSVAAQRPDEQAQHVDFPLMVVRLEGEDVAGRVVHQRVDAQRENAAVDAQRRAVADIAMDERHRPGRLPAEPSLRAAPVTQRNPVQPRLDVEAPQRRGREDVLVHASGGDEGPEDEDGGGARMLAADLEEELLELGSERLRAAGVLAFSGGEPVEAAPPVPVEPALQRRDREAARRLRAGWAEALFGQLLECGTELTAVHLCLRECADEAVAEHRHGLLACLRGECVHRVSLRVKGAPMPAPAPRRDGLLGWIELRERSPRMARSESIMQRARRLGTQAPSQPAAPARAPRTRRWRAPRRRQCPAPVWR